MKKRLIIMFLTILILSSIPINSLAGHNSDSGSGQSGSYVYGKYRYHEWAYKVSIYVGLSDTVTTSSSFSELRQLGEPVYWRPGFSIPSNTLFTDYNKPNYLQGAGLGPSANVIEIVDSKVPRIPLTHGGNLNSVKNFFGDTGTLLRTIDKIAQSQGISRENLVSGISFTINGESGTKNPEDILPVKGSDGVYKNQVPWLIVYEPVTIAHLRDGKTRLAFTATEYALAQKAGMFNFFYSGDPIPQWIANMTHANLPNSITLEHDWFGFKAYKPLGYNVKWSDDRIIAGGGWGMRFLGPNGMAEDEPENDVGIGEYRTDTDVVVSFDIQAGELPAPGCNGQSESDPPKHVVKLHVDGINQTKYQEVYLPSTGSQLVWIKFHTPEKPTSLNVTAEVVSQGAGGSWISGPSLKVVNTVDLDEFRPPDPRAEDPKTKKPVTKPKDFKLVDTPKKVQELTNEWGEYAPAWWVPNWVWHSSDYDGYWCDHGWWEFYLNHHTATVTKKKDIKPDERVETAKQQYSKWTMGSGYGYNIDSQIKVSHNARFDDVANQANAVTFFPEFRYGEFMRLGERISNGLFKLRENEYSTFNNRVHFTPLWYPDGVYKSHTELIDIWTPAGHLYGHENKDINIKGSVMDDWKVVPSKSK